MMALYSVIAGLEMGIEVLSQNANWSWRAAGIEKSHPYLIPRSILNGTIQSATTQLCKVMAVVVEW